MPWNYKRREAKLDASELSVVYFEKVEDYRRRHRLNISQFADKIGITRQTYYGWQRGRVPQRGLREYLDRVLEA